MVMPPSLEARNYQCPGNANKQHKTRDSILQINAPLRVIFGRRGPVGGEVFGSRAIPQAKPGTSETPNTSPPAGPCRGTKKAPSALDGFGCPTEAPYGCFLPDLTRFGTCRHPNPSNALGARYILPAPARWGKVANLGRGFLTTWAIRSTSCQISPVPKRLV